MCSMCPPNAEGDQPFAGDPDECQFIDWTYEETGWPTYNNCEPAGIAELRGPEVEVGTESEYVDDNWDKWSDDAASWPVPNAWRIDTRGELPDWLVKAEGFVVVDVEDDIAFVAEAVDLPPLEETLAGVG